MKVIIEKDNTKDISGNIKSDFLKGEKGDKGDKGDIGPQGIQGPKGDIGPEGIQGPKGDVGPKGEMGEPGYTPIKGVDYFTENDINTIINITDNKYANAIKQELSKIKEAQINSTGANLQNVQFFGESVQETEPSVDNPSPINSITNVDYKIIEKNMAPANVETKTISGVSVKNNNDGTYTLNGTTTGERSFGFYAKSEEQKVNLKEGKTYKLVVKEFSGSKTAGSVTSAVRKDTGELVYNYITQGSPVVAAKYNSTLEFINLYVSSAGVIFNNYRIGVMLIENGQDEDFEAYKEKTTTITLPEETELCSLPNGVEDCVDSTGVIHKKIIKISLGTQNWAAFPSSGNPDRYYAYTADLDNLIKTYSSPNVYNFCNVAKSINLMMTSTIVDTDTFCIGYVGEKRIRFMFKMSDIDVQVGENLSEKINNLFISKNAYILAENIEETTQNLGETEKAKLQNLETFEGVNNITSNAPISAVYNTDTKSYIDSKFNTLAQQILNIAGGN